MTDEKAELTAAGHRQINIAHGWPDPTPAMLNDPRFEAVWQCIKTWDINVTNQYSGYCGATGNHVRAILDALAKAEQDPVYDSTRYLLGQLRRVSGPCNTPMWEAPDGRGGQFADASVALRCWLDRAKGA